MISSALKDYKNPDLDSSERMFLPLADRKTKTMIQIFHSLVQKSNPELRYCAQCHVIVETSTGNKYHREYKNVYTSKQMKGQRIISIFIF